MLIIKKSVPVVIRAVTETEVFFIEEETRRSTTDQDTCMGVVERRQLHYNLVMFKSTGADVLDGRATIVAALS